MKVSCPICKKKTPWKGNLDRPFCSERCKLIDLGQWANEGYRIPVPSPSDPEEASPPREENGNGGDTGA